MPADTELYERIIAAKLFMDENFHEPIHQHLWQNTACLSYFKKVTTGKTIIGAGRHQHTGSL